MVSTLETCYHVRTLGALSRSRASVHRASRRHHNKPVPRGWDVYRSRTDTPSDFSQSICYVGYCVHAPVLIRLPYDLVCQVSWPVDQGPAPLTQIMQAVTLSGDELR